MIKYFIQNIRISWAIILVALLPMVVVGMMAAQRIMKSMETVATLEPLQQISELAVHMSDLVHEQQKERGATALFLGSEGTEFRNELQALRKETNRKKTIFLDYSKRFNKMSYGEAFYDRFTRLLHALEQMDDIRHRVDKLTIITEDIMRYYSDLNAEILTLIGSMAWQDSRAEISNVIHAYVNFMQSKERAGIERAVGSNAFVKGAFDPVALDYFKQLGNEQRIYLDVFFSMASDAQRSYYWSRLNADAVEEVKQMRQQALSAPEAISLDAGRWYRSMTGKINLLKEVENKLSNDLRKSANKLIQEAKTRQRKELIIIGSIVLVTSFFSFFIIRNINRSFSDLFSAMDAIANGDSQAQLPPKTNNEIGNMVSAAEVFKKRLEQNQTMTEELSRQKESLADEVEARTAELRLSEARSRAIIESSIDGIITINPEGIVQSFSPSAERIFGYDSDEVIGQNINMLMPEPYQSEHDGYLKHYRDTDEKKIIGVGREVEAKRKNGEIFPIRLSVSEAKTEKERFFVGTVTDISVEKKVRDEIQLKDQVIQNAKDAIIIAKADDIDNGPYIIYVNEAFTDISGYTADEVIGGTPRILQGQNTSRKTLDEIRRCLEAGEPFRGELINYDKTHKEYWLDINIVPIRDDKGVVTHFAAIERDITDRKNQEKELLAARDEAERANQTKSDFLANMSHELRTPLNSLLILSRELMDNDEGNLSADQVDDATVIYESGNDLLTLINDILDLAKIESGKMDALVEDIVVEEIANNIHMKFRHVAADRGLELIVEMDEMLPQIIQSDKLRIEQVLRNFLSNAFKFTHEGSVSLRIYVPDDSVTFYDTNLDAENMLAFAVTDTGIGIASNKQEAVFEAFQQADGSTTRKYGGTGLGLSISRELAELLGGEVHLKSEEGMGSTFTLYIKKELQPKRSGKNTIFSTTKHRGDAKIPLLRESDMQTLPDNILQDDRDAISQGDSVILVVDDDTRFLNILIGKVRQKGHKCLASASSIEGLQMIAKYRPDAVILDIDMPEMDGINFYERLRRHESTQNLPVYFISIHDEMPALSDDNAIGFLSKPVSAQQLEQAFMDIEAVALAPIKHLLIVEDDENLRRAVCQVITKRYVRISEAANGLEALEILKLETPDCILLDLMMPEMDGITFLKAAAEDTALTLPRVIVYSAKEISEEEEEIIELYTDRFIRKKGETAEEVIGKLYDAVRGNAQIASDSEKEAPKPAEKKASSRQKNEKAHYDFSGYKILIVDDEPRNIFALSRMLKSTNLEIHTAGDGQEAIDMLSTIPDMDAVLMDIMMPGMNGYEAMEAIRKQPQWENLPMIAITAKAMEGDEAKCLEAGATAYLPKPVDKDSLLSKLAEINNLEGAA